MARIPAKLTNERREQVWNLMLTGHNPQSIIKTLGTTQTVIYNDIKFLTNRSKEYVYEIAQGGYICGYIDESSYHSTSDIYESHRFFCGTTESIFLLLV